MPFPMTRATRILHVGGGQIGPVSPEVWDYETSGMKIIRKWFGYRKKDPAGRRSSPLDDINAEYWPAHYTTQLLELLNVLEMLIDIEPRQADLLERICEGLQITVADLRQESMSSLCLPVPRKPETSKRFPQTVPTLLVT